MHAHYVLAPYKVLYMDYLFVFFVRTPQEVAIETQRSNMTCLGESMVELVFKFRSDFSDHPLNCHTILPPTTCLSKDLK